MRHGDVFRKLSRPLHKRMNLLRNLATYLFQYERIQTTLARGKELQRFAEKLITAARKGTEAAKKRIKTDITKEEVQNKLFTTLATRYSTRAGGYTRLWRAGTRPGDGAPISIVELVDNPSDMKKAFERYRQENALRARVAQNN